MNLLQQGLELQAASIGKKAPPAPTYRAPVEIVCRVCGGKSIGPCPQSACHKPDPY